MRETLIKEQPNQEKLSILKVIKRNKPYTPIFKRIAAKSIDPPTGASTWAFGNHKWTPYIGNFTKKALTKKIVPH